MYRHGRSLFSGSLTGTGGLEASFIFPSTTNYSALQSAEAKNFATLTFAGRANQSFHMIEIALQRFATRSGEAVFRLRQTPIERLRAHDVVGFFQLARVDTQVAVGGLQHRFQFVEGQRTVYGQRADDPEAHTLVNQPIEIGGYGFFRRRRDGGQRRFAFPPRVSFVSRSEER